MIHISNRNKNDRRKSDDRRAENIKHEKKDYKEPHLCQNGNCDNFRMEMSDVCSECYEKISNEMSKTVTSDECKPMKLYVNESYINFMKLIEGEEDER